MLRYVCVWLLCLASLGATVKITKDIRTYSSASKGGELFSGLVQQVFVSEEGPGFISQQWFTSIPPSSRVLIYIDGEGSPSLDFDLYMFIGVGNCSDSSTNSTPWSTRRFGHLATKGGIYSNLRIPFTKSIIVKIVSQVSGPYFYMARLVYGSPLVINGYELPNNTRLRLYSIDRHLFQPYEFIQSASVSGKAGWLYMITLSANSSDYIFMEACFRLYIDDQKVQFLSSGTEDLFLSAYYFDAGIYHGDEAGLTCFDGNGMMSAYKIFEDDPIFFNNKMSLVYRCGEKQGDLEGCPNSFQERQAAFADVNLNAAPKVGDAWVPKNTTVSLYAWVYEYDL